MTQSYDNKFKPPYYQSRKVKRQHKDDRKNFDYTMIADRLKTVSWTNYCYRTAVVKPVYGIPTFFEQELFFFYWSYVINKSCLKNQVILSIGLHILFI